MRNDAVEERAGVCGIAGGASPDAEFLERMAAELWLRRFEHPAEPRQEHAETFLT